MTVNEQTLGQKDYLRKAQEKDWVGRRLNSVSSSGNDFKLKSEGSGSVSSGKKIAGDGVGSG